MARSRKRKPKATGRIPARALLALFLAACLLGAISYAWYHFQSESEQERITLGIARGIDPLRDSDRLPRPVLMWLDGLIEKLPGAAVTPIHVSGFAPISNQAYAGFPKWADTQTQPPHITILQNAAYTVGYDEDLQAPRWSAFRLFKVPTIQAPPRPDGFLSDRRSKARVVTDDYRGSGFDRGHLAPSYGIGLCYGAEAQKETFLLTNIIAQNPDLNRGPWAALERRKATRIAFRLGEVWAIVGPVFTRQPPERLSSGIAVPDQLFCLLLDTRRDGSLRALALVMPNDSSVSLPLNRYLVSVDELEALTNFDFFAALPDPVEAAVEASTPLFIW